MPDVKVYSTKSCPWCKKAKEYLDSKKIKYTNYFVEDDDAKRDEMIELSGQMGVPVIVIGKKVIVGFNQDAIDAALKA
ncbi:MAG: glutaredoxin family protein [Candidatus Woesearchaeota archaeon]